MHALHRGPRDYQTGKVRLQFGGPQGGELVLRNQTESHAASSKSWKNLATAGQQMYYRQLRERFFIHQ